MSNLLFLFALLSTVSCVSRWQAQRAFVGPVPTSIGIPPGGPSAPSFPVGLLRRDIDSVNCLLFRRNCEDTVTQDTVEFPRNRELYPNRDQNYYYYQQHQQVPWLDPWRIATRGEPAPTGNTVKLSVYMESQCPDTSRFVHKQLMKAWEKLGSSGRVDITLIPFGKARCVEKGDDFECSCQHGANECALNQLMNCVIDRVGFPDKYVPVVNCIQGERTLEGAIGKCLAGKNVTDEEQMRTCANGPRGRRLLALAGAQTVALKPSLNFVPWITINGERSSDALYDLTENLCKKLQPAPEGCTEYKL